MPPKFLDNFIRNFRPKTIQDQQASQPEFDPQHYFIPEISADGKEVVSNMGACLWILGSPCNISTWNDDSKVFTNQVGHELEISAILENGQQRITEMIAGNPKYVLGVTPQGIIYLQNTKDFQGVFFVSERLAPEQIKAWLDSIPFKKVRFLDNIAERLNRFGNGIFTQKEV